MQPPTVLLIEDNPVNTELFADLLTAAGFAVLTAATAERGIQLAQTVFPEIILMDISLPGLDGLAATRMLKSDPLSNQIPILALTAHAMPGDEVKALAAGCDGYVAKPIDTRSFASTVAAFLPSHGRSSMATEQSARRKQDKAHESHHST